MKKIRITESDLHAIVENAVKSIIGEGVDGITDFDAIMDFIAQNKANADEPEVNKPDEDKRSNKINRLKQKASKPILGAEFDDEGNEIDAAERKMYDQGYSDLYDAENPNETQRGIPTGWRDLYMKARRNRIKSSKMKRDGDSGAYGKSLDDAWHKALEAEYPDPKARAKAFNDFTNRIDKFSGYQKQRLDDIDDDDPNAEWNIRKRR